MPLHEAHTPSADGAPPPGSGFDVYDAELEYRLGRLRNRHSNYITQARPTCVQIALVSQPTPLRGVLRLFAWDP